MIAANIPTITIDGRELKSGYMTQLPVVRRAENRPGSCRFTVVNDFTVPADNIMNASFGGWVSGTGALAVGSEVIVNDDVGMVFRGRVTTIDSTKPDLVTVECTDGIGLLAKVGNDLYRNYYGDYEPDKKCNVGVANNVPYIDLASGGVPSDAVIASGAAEWAMDNSQTYGDAENSGVFKHISTYPVNYDIIRGVTVYPPSTYNGLILSKVDYSVYLDNVLLKKVTISPYSTDAFYINFDPTYARNKTLKVVGEPTIQYYPPQHPQHSSWGTSIRTSSMSGATFSGNYPTFRLLSGTNYTFAGFQDFNTPNKCMKVKLEAYNYSTVAGNQSPGRYNVPSLNVSEATPAFFGRARVSYTTGTAPVATVMNEIAKAIGMTFSDVSAKSKSLKEFRVGGGSVLDYFQLLADLRTSAGDNHSFDVNGTAIRLGLRKTVADAAVLRVLYGSENPSGNHAYLMSFRPTQTSKRKPNKVNVRGNIVYDDAGTKKTRPVVATVSDPGAKGVENCLTVFNNSLSSEADAYALAYSKLAEAKADSWEGTALLSGIHKVFNGDGSGEIVAIHHPLYSMNGYKTKVVEAVHDYNEQTTEIVLNSNSILYGNDVKDAGSMALITGNMSGDSAAQNLYYMQYVRVETTAAQSILSSGNKMTITYNKGTSTESLEVPVKSIVKHIKLGRQHVTATFEASLSKFSDKEHGVYQVKINNGAAISINEYRRPDFYKGQILIVDIMCPL